MSSAAGPAAQKLATQLAEDFGLLGLSQEMFFVGCFRTGGWLEHQFGEILGGILLGLYWILLG